MDEVVLAPTRDRSILGQMNDFTHSTRCQFAGLGRDRVDLRETEEEDLWITPCLCSKAADEVIFPINAARALLTEKWGRGV